MKREHDELASTRRKENYSKIWFVKALELLKQEKIKFKDIIDVGVGRGEFLEILRNNFDISKPVGVDYTETNLKTLNSKNIEAIDIDLDNFNIEDYSNLKHRFDLVISLETIEHIFNTDRLFQFFHFLLKENGYLLISTPNMEAFHFKLFYLLKGYPFEENHHVRFFNKKKLQQYTFFNGFSPVKWNNYFTFLFGIIERGFGFRNRFLVCSVALLFFGPLLVFRKLNLFNSLVNNSFVVLFRKSHFRSLGLEIDNFKRNFGALPDKEKALWLKRIKKYYQNDKLKEHISFKSHIEEIIR